MDIGGMENVIASLVRTIDKTTFRTAIACIINEGPLGAKLKGEGFNLISPVKSLGKASFIYPGLLIDVIKSQNADVIHCHSGYWYRAALAGLFAGVKGVVYTEHGRTVFETNKERLSDKLASYGTCKIVPVSAALQIYLTDILGVPRHKISLIENGVDTSHYNARPRNDLILKEMGIASSTFVMGTIARLDKVKDHHCLLKSLALIKNNFKDIKLLIIGDGPERKKIETYIQDYNLQHEVILTGFRTDIAEVLSIMDLLVLTSLSEGTSITVLEAMASGKPVVATDVGGNSRLVMHNETGFLVPPKNPDATAACILSCISDKGMTQAMGLRGRQRVEKHFSVDHMVREYEKLYLDIMNDR